jgi:hypothetical protein
MPRWSRQEQHGVRKDSLNLPRFYSQIQVQFSFLLQFAFCSFTLWILHQLLCFTEMLLAFKMGVKNVLHFTIVCFDRAALSSDTSRYFILCRAAYRWTLHNILFSAEPLYRWALHDVLFSAEPPYRSTLHDSLFRPSRFIFQHFKIVCFDRAALSFGASRQFISTESHYLSALHNSLFFARTPFA